MQDQVDDRRVGPGGERGGIAADGGADHREYSRPDDGSDAKGGEGDGAEGLFESVFGPLRFRDQFVDGFGGEDLTRQRGCSSAR